MALAVKCMLRPQNTPNLTKPENAYQPRKLGKGYLDLGGGTKYGECGSVGDYYLILIKNNYVELV